MNCRSMALSALCLTLQNTLYLQSIRILTNSKQYGILICK